MGYLKLLNALFSSNFLIVGLVLQTNAFLKDNNVSKVPFSCMHSSLICETKSDHRLNTFCWTLNTWLGEIPKIFENSPLKPLNGQPNLGQC